MNKGKEILQHIKYFKESSASSFLVLLVSADLVFIALHFIWGSTSLLSDDLYSISGP